jgi:hypothetical protein
VFILSYYLSLCTGIVLAYFVAALSPNMDVANAALPTYVGERRGAGCFPGRRAACVRVAARWCSGADIGLDKLLTPSCPPFASATTNDSDVS